MAVLRAYGPNFDVDEFLDGCTLPVCAVKRRGEPVFPASQPNGPFREQSGVHVSVGDAEFDDFPKQVEEAISFLESNAEQLRRLVEFPGVEGDVELDFGIERRDVSPCSAIASRRASCGWRALWDWRSWCRCIPARTPRKRVDRYSTAALASAAYASFTFATRRLTVSAT
jgi:hypothetical protein